MNNTAEILQTVIEFTKHPNFYTTADIDCDFKDDFEIFTFGFYFKIQDTKIEQIDYNEYIKLTQNKRSYCIGMPNDIKLFLNLLYKRFDVKNKFPEVVI